MYLASFQENGQRKNIIRNSYYDTHTARYSSRQVFDLGDNPRRYIHCITERVLYFDEALEDAVATECQCDPTTLLEELLWDFLPLETRRLIRDFGRKGNYKLRPMSRDERKEVLRFIHPFDRRRLYYIRYGASDQSRMYQLSEKLYRPLLFKCRDEKEYYFKEIERSLPPREFKKYIFVIFNLRRHFSENFAVAMPQALDAEKMDEVFLDELCRLNNDASFWQDNAQYAFLRPHLEEYVIRYFDHDFEEQSFTRDYIRDFYARHRTFRWPAPQSGLSDEETSVIFGRQIGELKKMRPAELTRLFRAKAKEHHPDNGGEAENFIKLLSAYEALKAILKG